MTVKAKPAGQGGLRRSATGSQQLHAHHTTGGDSGQPVYAAGRVVGHVANGILRKTARGSIHQLRKPPAWALDVDSLRQAEALGARQVAIHDTESDRTYRADVEQLKRYGFAFDRGFGQQIGLPLDRWTVTQPSEPEAQQMRLFDGGGL